jgi:hypothetical protein
MTTYSSVNLETEIDLNSLFTLSYNFDLLKGVLEALVKSQKATNQKLEDFEDNLRRKDLTINE